MLAKRPTLLEHRPNHSLQRSNRTILVYRIDTLRTAGSFATSASGAVRSPHHLSASGEDEPALTQALEPPKGTGSRVAKSVPATDARTVWAAAAPYLEGSVAGWCKLKVRAWCEREA